MCRIHVTPVQLIELIGAPLAFELWKRDSRFTSYPLAGIGGYALATCFGILSNIVLKHLEDSPQKRGRIYSFFETTLFQTAAGALLARIFFQKDMTIATQKEEMVWMALAVCAIATGCKLGLRALYRELKNKLANTSTITSTSRAIVAIKSPSRELQAKSEKKGGALQIGKQSPFVFTKSKNQDVARKGGQAMQQVSRRVMEAIGMTDLNRAQRGSGSTIERRDEHGNVVKAGEKNSLETDQHQMRAGWMVRQTSDGGGEVTTKFAWKRKKNDDDMGAVRDEEEEVRVEELGSGSGSDKPAVTPQKTGTKFLTAK